jgi:hypothetical protein
LVPGVKQLGHEADHSPPSSAKVRSGGNVYALLQTPSWRGVSLSAGATFLPFTVNELCTVGIILSGRLGLERLMGLNQVFMFNVIYVNFELVKIKLATTRKALACLCISREVRLRHKNHYIF